MASIYDAYIGSMPTEQDYMSQDPYMQGARSVAGMQFQPRNNTEAILLPLLQGLGVGVMGGMGTYNAREQMFDDIKNSPLLQAYTAELGGNVGPLASGDQYEALLNNYAAHDYTQENAPERWNAKTGKADLIMAAIQEQSRQEDEQKKEASRLQLENQMSGQNNAFTNTAKLEGITFDANGTPSIDPAMLEIKKQLALASAGPGQDRGMRDSLIKEEGATKKAKEAETALRQAYKDARDADPIQQFNPLSDDFTKFKSANSAIELALVSSWKGPMSEGDRKAIADLKPERMNNDSQIKIKEDRLLAMWKANQEGTPFTDAVTKAGGGNQEKQGGGISRDDALAELRRRGKLPTAGGGKYG